MKYEVKLHFNIWRSNKFLAYLIGHDVSTLVALQISERYLVSSHTRRGISESDPNKCCVNSI